MKRYFYTGSIRRLKKQGFKIHFQKDDNKRFVYANRNYEEDKENSLFIFLGNALVSGSVKNEITFNNPNRNHDDIEEYIKDLLKNDLVRIEEKENEK
jgi:hypothetical protein